MNEDKINIIRGLLRSALDILDPEQKLLKPDVPEKQRRIEFPAVCHVCGKNCTVPFEPKNDSPILCRDCYKKKMGN